MHYELTLAHLALTQYGLAQIKTLYDEEGSAEAALSRLGRRFPSEEAIVQEEIEWCEKNNVRILTISDADYPDRLRHCPDAPMVLFTRGKADLNAQHIISIIGTRKCTQYGRQVINDIVKNLAQQRPDILVVSGLAYGVDINAHRAALDRGLSTVGVVAHGQDTLYPSLHRNEANRMCIGNGGVLTEFFHGTRSLAPYFLQRNRIIAGMSDATLVIESASHGGGLATARMAQEYNREVLAVPGPVNAEYSQGCNNLIRDNRAALVTSAEDIMHLLQWQDASVVSAKRSHGVERQLFPSLSPDEQRVVDALQQGDLQTNALAIQTAIPIGTLTALLFSLEMKGMVKPLSGNVYHLI